MEHSIKKIFIADDHQIFVDGLKSLLNQYPDMEVVDQATNGVELLEKLKHIVPDLILLDINMPKKNGIAATQEIIELYPSVKIIILTMHKDPLMIKKILNAGAHSILVKNNSINEILESIEQTLKGNSVYSPEITEAIMNGYKTENTATAVKIAPLTKREKEIVKLVVEQYKTREIAEKLFISMETVKSHRKNIIQKLAVKNTAGLVKYAVENGLDA